MDYKRLPEKIKSSKEKRQWNKKKKITRTYNNNSRFILEVLNGMATR